MFLEIFRPYEQVLTALLKNKKLFSLTVFTSKFLLTLQSLKECGNFLLNHQIFLLLFLLVLVLKKRYKHDSSSSKQKACHEAINRQSSNLRIAPQMYIRYD